MTEAVIRVCIESDIQRLRTDAGLQVFMGDDATRIASMAGRLVYIVSFAAGLHNLWNTPEASILAGTANALADIANTPEELDRQRGAVIAGLSAIDRLMPSLDHWDMRTGRNHARRLNECRHSLDHWDMRTGRNCSPCTYRA